MMEVLGSEARCSGFPAARMSVAAEAAMPMQSVRTGALMNCMVSYIDRHAVTTPPGELMCMSIGLVGASASRNNNCAQISEAMVSSICPLTKMIRSRNRRE